MTNNYWQLKHGFILASGSPQRKALLERVRLVPDKIVSPDICEELLPNELPRRYVQRIAIQKARAVAKQYPNTCVLAADTVLAVGRRIIRKATDENEAKSHLLLLSGRKHHVITGLCIITPAGKEIIRVNSTAIILKKLSEKDIQFILKSNEWQHVAGYRIEGIIAAFVKQMCGSYDSVVGLPTYELVQIMRGIAGT